MTVSILDDMPGPFARFVRTLLRRSAPPPVAIERLPARRPIPVRRVEPSRIGRGSVDPGHRQGVKRIVVTVDDDLFARVRDYAAAHRISFAAAARALIERGFASIESGL